MQLREIYNKFLASGELFELIPNATGSWEKDKRIFQDLMPKAEDVTQKITLESILDEDDDFDY